LFYGGQQRGFPFADERTFRHQRAAYASGNGGWNAGIFYILVGTHHRGLCLLGFCLDQIELLLADRLNFVQRLIALQIQQRGFEVGSRGIPCRTVTACIDLK